ncbi:MAG: flagellar hook capping FlgD N-terminal domain-containing protein [Terracidiphilus sp.]
MATTTGIWNHETAGTAFPEMKAMDSSTTSSAGDSSSNSATISANDFLTLLVTEMQNQDPTADTDPNEYINQLVNVNSLEQLISINQTLSTATAGTTSPVPTGGTSGVGATADSVSSPSSPLKTTAQVPGIATAPSATGHAAQESSARHLAPGNLSVPQANPSALRVAQSLDGR